jgi:SAM-dependent methyltransferase
MIEKYKIKLPKIQTNNLDQDKEYFFLIEPDGTKRKILFHEYAEIFKIKGLYEQLFYERLQCNSPAKVSKALSYSVSQVQENMSKLRILDLGAGNGIMGAHLRKKGVSRLVGADIIPEAKEAAERDRPLVYDTYYDVDFANLTLEQREDLQDWSFNCLTTVAALGFGDIPVKAFFEAYNILQKNAWIAFNIKEVFFNNGDQSLNAIRQLIFSDFFDLYYLERYQHRLSMEGEPLYYFAIAGRKKADISKKFLSSTGIMDK